MPRLLILAIIALAAMFPAMASGSVTPSAWVATAQIPDRVRIDGQDYALNTNPLTPLLGKKVSGKGVRDNS